MNKGKHKHVKQFNIIEDRMIQQENRRLMKRLNEIGNRKNELYKSLDEDNSFYTIQVKSREVYRRRK